MMAARASLVRPSHGCRAETKDICAKTPRSIPAQKFAPSPSSTTHRVPESASKAVNAASYSSHMSMLNAFALSGRFKVSAVS
jgi:hypothetical protein